MMVVLIALLIVAATNLPRIIWALRCPADSPHYKCPPAARVPIVAVKLPNPLKRQP